MRGWEDGEKAGIFKPPCHLQTQRTAWLRSPVLFAPGFSNTLATCRMSRGNSSMFFCCVPKGVIMLGGAMAGSVLCRVHPVLPDAWLRPPAQPLCHKEQCCFCKEFNQTDTGHSNQKATWVRPVIRKSGCEIKTAQAKPQCQVFLLQQKQNKWNKPFKEVSSGLNNLPEQKKNIKPIVLMIQKPMVSLESFLFSGTCCFVAMPVLSWKDAHTSGTVSFSPN